MDRTLIYNRVNEILMKDFYSRENDSWLYLRILINLGLAHKDKDKITIDLKDIEKLPPPESIRRTRQKIQNDEGRYRPEQKIIEKRKNYQKEQTEYYSKNKSNCHGLMANSYLC